MLPGGDLPFVEQAARRGVFAYVVDCDAAALQGALDIVLRRFAEYHNLEGAFGRRAVTERAKGILMERHQVDERQAFDLMRDHARRSGRKLVDVAESVLDSHLLLGTGTAAPARARRGARARAGEQSAVDATDPRSDG
jgi:response regulator NasT